MANLRELGESMLAAVSQWADPRERELRRRRRARRKTIRYGAASGATIAGAVGLSAAAAPAWAIVLTGGGAAVLVIPAAFAIRRYRRLQRRPLPPPARRRRTIPPAGSAARAAMLQLVEAERSLIGLFDAIAAGARVPPGELAETADTAQAAADALEALAVDVVALERARSRVPDRAVADDLDAAAVLALGRLRSGTGEYLQLLRAAGRMLAPARTAQLDRRSALGLREAADRLDGWAEALAELAEQSDVRRR